MKTTNSSKSAAEQDVNSTPQKSVDSQLLEGRAFFDSLGNSYPVAESVEVRQEHVADVSCYWFTPENPLQDKLIIYLHGGAFCWGSIQSHKAMVSHFANETGIKILFVEYALAPEYPFPKGMLDLINVYKKIIADFPQTDITLMGDSAGGGLVASSVHKMQRDGIQQPGAVVLISPWLNLEVNTPSYTNNASLDPILTTESLKQFAQLYNPGLLSGANVSRLKFEHFPPTLIIVGTNEILQDDSQIFFDTIRKIQPESTLRVFQGQTHVWMMTNIDHADSKRALTYVKTFLTNTTR